MRKIKNSKSAKLLTVFTLTATTLMFTGCSLEEQPYDDAYQSENSEDGGIYTSDYEDQQLIDDNGKKYTLHQNDDGTETAYYEDGQRVTFKRDEQGNLDYVSGNSGLLAGLIAGYFLFHGYSTPVGAWNSASNRYVISEPLKGASQSSRATGMQKYVPSNANFNPNKIPRLPYQKELSDEQRTAGVFGGYTSSSKNDISNNSSAKSSKSVGTVKSGFGGAGVRSGAS